MTHGRARRRRRARWPRALGLAVVLAAAAGAAALALGVLGKGPSATGPAPAGAHAGGGAAADAAAPLVPPPPANAPQPHSWARTPADGATAVHVVFRKPPRSGLLVDGRSGTVLWSDHPERVLPIASLTKIMTALLVDERLRPRDPVPITRAALAYTGSGIGMLPLGRRVRERTLLYGLLLPSGNDAAIALAQRVSGTVAGFVALMNRRARAMGLTCTRFASPSGIVDAGNHSCAPDLALLARELLRRPRLARIVRTPLAVMPLPIRGGKVWLANHNPLLLARYPGVDGVKTGYTEAAGRCYVVSVTRGGRRLIAVLLDSPDPAKQARRLLDAGFGVGA
jgi:serine-type D-Ala-D-Ala carboxypeptidase (penicillin-binding protein 5/6)